MMKRAMGFRRPTLWIQQQTTIASTSSRGTRSTQQHRSSAAYRPSRIYPSPTEVDESASVSSSSLRKSLGLAYRTTPAVLRRFGWIIVCLVLAVQTSIHGVRDVATPPQGGGRSADGTMSQNYALRISHPDEFLLFDWPIQGFLESDFTIELDYRTWKDSSHVVPVATSANKKYSTRIDDKVLIIGNVRESNDGKQYGRGFALYVSKHSGQLLVEFSGYNPITKSFASGIIDTKPAQDTTQQPQRIDDGKWHHIRLVRESGCEDAPGVSMRKKSERISQLHLIVDGATLGTTEMPLGHDYDGQEQRVLIGGGNDRNFRLCDIDNVQLWTVARLDVAHHERLERVGSLPARVSCMDHGPSLVMQLSFDLKAPSVMAHDCAPRGGGAIRVGEHLQDSSAFVPGAPSSELCPRCRSYQDPVDMDSSRRLSTAIVTFFGVDCPNEGVWFEKGHLYQLEAYLGALWLDANRLKMKLFILTECLPQHIMDLYTTRFVTFLDIRDHNKVNFTMPSECRATDGEVAAVVKRFLVIRHVLEQRQLDAFDYIVHADLRDSRIFHWPDWTTESTVKVQRAALPKVPKELWLQSIRRDVTKVCGGFQAGARPAMKKLMLAMEKAVKDLNCHQEAWDDQTVLNDLYSKGLLGTTHDRIALDGHIVSSQHTRTFSGQTAFVHGDWWMSKNMINDAYAAYAYPEGVSVRRTLTGNVSCVGKVSRISMRLLELMNRGNTGNKL